MKPPGFHQPIEISRAESGNHRRLICRDHSHLLSAVATMSNHDAPLSYGDRFLNLQVDFGLLFGFQLFPESPQLRRSLFVCSQNRTNKFVTTRVELALELDLANLAALISPQP